MGAEWSLMVEVVMVRNEDCGVGEVRRGGNSKLEDCYGWWLGFCGGCSDGEDGSCMDVVWVWWRR